MEDAELIAQCRAGRGAAFNELVERYQKRLYFFALRLTQDHGEAEDITQETFLRAYQGLSGFRAEGRFLSWLLTIAANYYHSIKRKKKRKTFTDVDLETLPHPGREDHLTELEEKVKRVVGQLPPKQRMALVLCTWEELSYREIAQVMSISIDSVKANLSYARQTLRQQLTEFSP